MPPTHWSAWQRPARHRSTTPSAVCALPALLYPAYKTGLLYWIACPETSKGLAIAVLDAQLQLRTLVIVSVLREAPQIYWCKGSFDPEQRNVAPQVSAGLLLRACTVNNKCSHKVWMHSSATALWYSPCMNSLLSRKPERRILSEVSATTAL